MSGLRVVSEPGTFEREVPWDREAEEATIASCLVDSSVVAEVAEVVTAEDFWHPAHRQVFAAAMAVWERGEDVVQITVAHELAVRGELEGVGGQTFIAELIRRLPTSMGARFYGEIVAKTAKLRKLISLASTVSRMAYEGDTAPETIADTMLDQLVKASVDRSKDMVRELRDILRGDMYESIVEMMAAPRLARGLSTGWAGLDEITDGLRPNRLHIVMADTGFGKSFLIANLAANIAKAGHNVLLFTTEMSGEEVVEREVFIAAGIDSGRYRVAGAFPQWAVTRVLEAMADLEKWPGKIFICDVGGIELRSLVAATRRQRARTGLSAVFVDHIQHVRVSRSDGRVQEMEGVVSGLRHLAANEDLPVVAVSHVGREAQKAGRIMANSGKGSSTIEQDANQVWTLNPVDETETFLEPEAARAWKLKHGHQLVRIDVGKSRAGIAGFTTLDFDNRVGGRFSADWAGQ